MISFDQIFDGLGVPSSVRSFPISPDQAGQPDPPESVPISPALARARAEIKRVLDCIDRGIHPSAGRTKCEDGKPCQYFHEWECRKAGAHVLGLRRCPFGRWEKDIYKTGGEHGAD